MHQRECVPDSDVLHEARDRRRVSKQKHCCDCRAAIASERAKAQAAADLLGAPFIRLARRPSSENCSSMVHCSTGRQHHSARARKTEL